jgi:hypothetical protein
MQRKILFTGSSGLNTEVDPVRHSYSSETGISELARAKNIKFDDTGRASIRKGWEYTSVTSAAHSLFCDGGEALFVTGNALTLLSPDMSTKALRNVTVGARMSYVQVGNRIYYTNGREKGFVRDRLSIAWEKPATVYHTKDSTRVLNGPPTGSLLEYHRGRMLIAQHNVIWESEQYDVNVYDLTKKFIQMEGTVTMLKGVTDGVWVGTRSRIAFLRGTHSGDYQYEPKGLFGAVLGTSVKAEGFMIADGSIQDIGVLFVGKYGPCFGTANGRLIPLTERKLSVPYALRGAGAVVNKRYIFTLED